MVRYADDLVVLCRWKPPETYMPKLRQFLARLRVTVNEDKTRIVAAQDGFDFLGVHFRKQPSRRDASKWFCYCWPSPRSMQRIRDKVKAAIGRDNRPALQEKLDRLNPILRGSSVQNLVRRVVVDFGVTRPGRPVLFMQVIVEIPRAIHQI